jgi:hypothetical protein
MMVMMGRKGTGYRSPGREKEWKRDGKIASREGGGDYFMGDK